jgi:hypothetical protein
MMTITIQSVTIGWFIKNFNYSNNPLYTHYIPIIYPLYTHYIPIIYPLYTHYIPIIYLL